MTDPFCIEVTTLGDLLVRAAYTQPDRDALVLPGERASYSDLLARAQRVARGLIRLGVPEGAHVGLLLPNSLDYVAGLFGIALAGCVAVPLNARHRATEVGYIIRHAELQVILTSRHEVDPIDFMDLLGKSLSSGESASDDAPAHPFPFKAAPLLRQIVILRGADHSAGMPFGEFNRLADTITAAEAEARRQRVRVRDIVILIYTSGTTANPKGCLLTHEAVLRGASERMRTRFKAEGRDVVWGAGPLFHIGSLGPFLGCVAVAGTYLTDVYFDPGRALALMGRERVTLAWPWFPAIVQALLNHPDFDPASLDDLRYVNVIGAPGLVTRMQEQLPQAEVLQSCGMTETAGIFAIASPGEPIEVRSVSNGRASPGVELRIVDPGGERDVPDDTIGEIWVRGYCVMESYWRDPANTAAALTPDRWLKTGDLYERRSDGNVVFRGRLKDMLKVGGENVATAEVEGCLCAHPDVSIAEVIGRPDARLDEVPVAFVELRREAATSEAELIEFCRGRIASFKVPRAVIFLQPGEWPMSLTKVDKRGLRRMLAARAGG